MNREKRIEKGKKRIDETFKKLILKSGIDMKTREGFERYVISKGKGYVYLRCHGIVRGSNPIKQCKKKAYKGFIVCKSHSGREPGPREKQMIAIEQRLGIYDRNIEKVLKKELQEVNAMDEEKLKDVTDELKVAVALFKKYLDSVPSEEIASSPGRLFYLLDNLVRFKRTHWEMKHAPEVSFSRDQVEYLFVRVRMIITEVVKDDAMLDKISDKFRILSLELKNSGFKA